MNDTSGRMSRRQFAFFDPDSSSWRMWPDIGLWGSVPFSATWPGSGMWDLGAAYELPTSAPLIGGSGSSLLPTPTAQQDGSASDLDKRQARVDAAKTKHGRIFGQTLEVAVALLPTPVATDANGARNETSGRSDPNSKHHSGTTLTDAVVMLPSAVLDL
jgi:hypothetical protein